MQSYLQQFYILEETAVLRKYNSLGLAVKYILICSWLYIGDFHWGWKYLKLLEKKNMAGKCFVVKT